MAVERGQASKSERTTTHRAMEAILDTTTELLHDGDSIKIAARWAIVLVFYVLCRLRYEGIPFSSSFRAEGLVAIVTGASAGVGRQTALGLAERGARVYIACRSEQRGRKACAAITARTGNVAVHWLPLDLASFAAVRHFVELFEQRERRLDVLVNNAAVLSADRAARTVDGLDMTMGVNHYGHFLLTALLMPRLRASAGPGRIVNVTSNGHGLVSLGKMTTDAKDEAESTADSPMQRYLQSKLANVLFTKELGRRLDVSGKAEDVTVNCVHPGWNMSRLSRHLGAVSVALNRTVCRVITLLFFRSTWAAAQTSLYAALDVNLLNVRGQYFVNKWFSRSAKNADDPELARQLWEHSELVTGVRFDVKLDGATRS